MSSEDRKKWFDKARSTGLFGRRYQTYDQFESAIKSLGEAGYTPRQVQRLVNYQASNAVIERKQGQLRINSRGIRESNENLVRADMDRVLGPGAADRVEAAQRKAWTEARKETTELTKGKTQRDLGHPQEGLPADPRVAPDENRVENQRNGREGNATRFFANNAEDFIEVTSNTDGGYQPRALVHGQVAWAREAERDRPGSLPNRAVSSDRAVSESANLHSLGYGTAQEIAPRARIIQASMDRGYTLPQIMEQIKATGSSIPDGQANDAVAQSGPVRQISGPTKSKVTVVGTDGKTQKRPVSINSATPASNPIPAKPKSIPTNLNQLTAQQIKYFNAGGGQAGMIRDGLSRDEVIARGRFLLNPKPPKPPKATVKPAVKPAAKPARPNAGRRGVTPVSRGTSRSRSTSAGNAWDNPLSPLNRNTLVNGAAERRTNDVMQDAPGYSPFWLRLAD